MARPPYRAEQRNQIFACFINAASELMENEGMESLTLRRVAKRAGYALQLLQGPGPSDGLRLNEIF